MLAATYDFSIDQGSDFALLLTLKDEAGVLIDLTGNTFAGQARITKEDAAPAFSFTFEIKNQTTNAGEVLMILSAAASTALELTDKQKYLYDVERTDAGGAKQRLIEGKVTMIKEVTR